jgi:hypothetical protein
MGCCQQEGVRHSKALIAGTRRDMIRYALLRPSVRGHSSHGTGDRL